MGNRELEYHQPGDPRALFLSVSTDTDSNRSSVFSQISSISTNTQYSTDIASTYSHNDDSDRALQENVDHTSRISKPSLPRIRANRLIKARTQPYKCPHCDKACSRAGTISDLIPKCEASYIDGDPVISALLRASTDRSFNSTPFSTKSRVQNKLFFGCSYRGHCLGNWDAWLGCIKTHQSTQSSAKADYNKLLRGLLKYSRIKEAIHWICLKKHGDQYAYLSYQWDATMARRFATLLELGPGLYGDLEKFLKMVLNDGELWECNVPIDDAPLPVETTDYGAVMNAMHAQIYFDDPLEEPSISIGSPPEQRDSTCTALPLPTTFGTVYDVRNNFDTHHSEIATATLEHLEAIEFSTDNKRGSKRPRPISASSQAEAVSRTRPVLAYEKPLPPIPLQYAIAGASQSLPIRSAGLSKPNSVGSLHEVQHTDVVSGSSGKSELKSDAVGNTIAAGEDWYSAPTDDAAFDRLGNLREASTPSKSAHRAVSSQSFSRRVEMEQIPPERWSSCSPPFGDLTASVPLHSVTGRSNSPPQQPTLKRRVAIKQLRLPRNALADVTLQASSAGPQEMQPDIETQEDVSFGCTVKTTIITPKEEMQYIPGPLTAWFLNENFSMFPPNYNNADVAFAGSADDQTNPPGASYEDYNDIFDIFEEYYS